MSTISHAIIPSIENPIKQGDVFKKVKYSYIDSEDNNLVNITELEFPHAIIISQACDVVFMSELLKEGKGKVTKYMPSILMCPIYNKDILRKPNFINFNEIDDFLHIENEPFFTSKHIEVAESDLHYRFHILSVFYEKKTLMDCSVIDFKHCFSVPATYLVNNVNNRIFTMNDIYAEQITLKFASYISRVGTP